MDRRQQHVELFLENGSRRVLTLEQGRDTGMWWLTREGILAPAGPQLEMASLFLRFDGEKLFIGPQPAALLEFRPPSSFETAGIRVAYRIGPPPDEQDDKTSVWLPTPARTTPARTPAAPAAAASDWDDATSISPARTFAGARTSPLPEEPVTAVPAPAPSASNDETRAVPRSEMRSNRGPAAPPAYPSDEPRTVIAVPMPKGRASDEPRTVIAVPMPGLRPGEDARPSPRARPVEEETPSASARPVEEAKPAASARPVEEAKPVASARPVEEPKVVVTPRPPEAPKPMPGDGETRVGPPPVAGGQARPVLEARPPFPQRDLNAAPPPSVSVAIPEANANATVNTAFTPFASLLRKPGKGAKAPKAPRDPKDPKKEGASKPTPIQIAIYSLMVVVMGVIAIGVVSGGEPARAPAPKAKALASASRSGASPVASSSTATRATAAAAATAVPTFATAATQSPVPSQATASAQAAPPPPAVANEDAPAAAKAAPAQSVGLRDVDERSAVLAVESGARERAASLYDSLAASHPERPVYREAARILRTKPAATP